MMYLTFSKNNVLGSSYVYRDSFQSNYRYSKYLQIYSDGFPKTNKIEVFTNNVIEIINKTNEYQ